MAKDNERGFGGRYGGDEVMLLWEQFNTNGVAFANGGIGGELHAEVKAASFDCEKAKSVVEKMICADAELSKLDEEVAKAYSKAKSSISNEKWKELIQKRQKQWLRERNTCDEAICLKNIYESRLASLKLALAATEEVIAQQNAIKRGPCGDWIFRDGATGHEPPLCYELLKRLNRYAQDGDVVPPDCGGIVLTSYPKFTLPPWEEVDIRQHQDLLYILMVYRANGHRGDRVLKVSEMGSDQVN